MIYMITKQNQNRSNANRQSKLSQYGSGTSHAGWLDSNISEYHLNNTDAKFLN